MAIGLTGEHEELAAAVRGLIERAVPDGPGGTGPGEPARTPPGLWAGLAGQGLLGLHLPEAHGGQGGGLPELAVALEELGRGLVGGPFLPTVLASALIDRFGGAAARERLLPGLADGSRTAAVAPGPALAAVPAPDGGIAVSGTLQPVLEGAAADHVLAPLLLDGREAWAVLDGTAFQRTELPALDLGRGVARLEADALPVPDGALLTGLDREDAEGIAAVLLGAEAAGIAAWCVAAAADYAKVRVQFGHPIGRFQGVKHKCARMAIGLEQARAAVWDAARAYAEHPGGAAPDRVRFAAAVAGLIAPGAALDCARDCIQVHGGIGFTWEHDAHRYLRRASALRILAGAAADRAADVADLALAGRRRPVEIGPQDAEDTALRERIREEAGALAAIADDTERFAAMAERGWVMPHLPRPWGRGAPPLEQVLIQQEARRAGLRGPGLAIGAWVVPSLAGHGTPGQQERFLRPTLRGEITWCQLFSEPGAGSDLASLSMRAERVEGGYRLTGQKIWTSMAQLAQWGICLARTDPGAPGKHEGITYFLVDMAAPGLEVRPLRELTGDAVFNEVFFDGVFVPDEQVVGRPGDGWRVARTTLSNERVALSGGSGLGAGVPELLDFLGKAPGAGGWGAAAPADPADRDVRVAAGRLIALGQAIELLGLRVTLKQLSGTEPGAESSVRKLLGVEFNQRVADYIWEHQGGAAVCADPSDATGVWARYMLFSRSMTIYGGTTEVQLNIIAERLLGLPRDPEA
ncbi:acyl-CoA dehydrogenase [Nocardiopsis composta]|uniref:Alkylation response protein AidB-like acyl-CoA dehydrogenase n=1 Tax=Nocardiopsis composta TaxID=157465 RepID=A0A7W8VE80_9ACTN|nr:acyl-CoA dehydrogenase [Nocardiopsis composta]MBB5432803.1 alkylation response protein AidB-like acyl-CoA dehydrogenase [Nocardiopsis composta]